MSENNKLGLAKASNTWRLGADWKIGNRSWPHPARLYSLGMGILYTTLGIAGFFRASGLTSRNFWGTNFLINGPHDVYHLVIGILGFAAYRVGREFQYARAMSVIFSFLSIAGFLSQPTFGLMTLNGGDIFLHGLTAIIGDGVCRVEVDEKLEAEVTALRSELDEVEARPGGD